MLYHHNFHGQLSPPIVLIPLTKYASPKRENSMRVILVMMMMMMMMMMMIMMVLTTYPPLKNILPQMQRQLLRSGLSSNNRKRSMN